MKYLFILDAELKGKKFKAGRKYELSETDGDKFVTRGAAEKVNVRS